MTKRDLYKISEIKLTYTRKVKADERPKISSSKDAHRLFRENWNDLTINLFEEFKILLLDRNNRCMGIVPISQGGVSGTLVDAKLVFSSALKARACGIILGHNHPSGNTTPSDSDINLTKRLVTAGKYLDISVLDHIILTDENHTSFADLSLM
ncbi:JAB domain-containing protein [Winogradskyella sp. SYSU M77433]|uniref:JAB domain-containing protein n=1 Tax=Winogradskyella sp. SYSU M77433 TaxID=3042722 RepID=UPI002481725B|nr:JAB domain-containing protein [Winogradskyella sp. SYSU M77433]MDH7911342.1 JAB domain-containing protein [Winogradskyella sp. SYSU M77433]